MTIKKFGTAHWEGSIKEGKGTVSTESGALSAQPYGFNTRFEGVAGTNPEELIGASHAACFAMALSGILGSAGLTATALDAKSVISLEKQADGFAVTAAHLTLTATIPGVTEDQFQELAAKAKAGCPISKLLKAEITLEATLKA
ncbi:osmotically inducible protein OsmC [Gluconacetobacter liquefaciens]|uniref:OsmC family protein n=1 Tax=Gluconacetobacter liquefaciens TaxID=89584 RepID=A0A370G0H2_GLULI|nr:OsmC family protein [Gluconacetobacter liquefaciens]MBB2187433.1 OsmC family protein [Gluconacetobacter liquefaciens]RDI36399.1 osmotically inducible protein OsmC [Gluconacetobacter liquefaciens]GBQ96717.1 osmotically inducible protein OsmC [Gluconacetobacter liquefaciens NRIC 0522]GEB37956.1 osmotically inducible protein OsmC [Gluconacetobacter liquefaciens]